jgi:hypothetical protein
VIALWQHEYRLTETLSFLKYSLSGRKDSVRLRDVLDKVDFLGHGAPMSNLAWGGVSGRMPGQARLDAPGILHHNAVVGGIEKRRIVNDAKYRGQVRFPPIDDDARFLAEKIIADMGYLPIIRKMLKRAS